MTNPIRGQIVGIAEAAKILGWSIRTVQEKCHSPCPPFRFFFDGLYRFDTADLYEYLTSIMVPAGPREETSEGKSA